MNEKLQREITGRPHFRIATHPTEEFKRALNIEQRTVDLSFASERTPIERYWGIELLDFSSKPELLTRWKNKPAFMENHSIRRGVINNGKLESGILAGTAKLSRSTEAESLLRDMEDEIAVHTSVGYFIHRMDEMKPEEMDEKLKEMCLANGLKAYKCQAEPFEGSSVDIPADISVGLGKRSIEFYDLLDISSPEKVVEGVRSYKPLEPDANGTVEKKITINQRSINMEEPKVPTTEEVLKANQERVSGILEYSARFVGKITKIEEMRDAALKDSKVTVEAFKGRIADVYSRSNPDDPIFTPDSKLDLSPKEQKRFSLLRAIQSQIPNSGVDASFERECSKEIAKRTNSEAKGIFIPWDIQNRSIRTPMTSGERERLQLLAIEHGLHNAARALNTTTSTGASELVGTDLRADLFVDLLRNKSVAGQVGVQILTGLKDNITLPRQTGAGQFQWTGESGTATAQNLATGNITLSPKEGRALQEYTRMLMLQSSPSIETLVQNDLLTIARLGIDLAVFHGTAANSQPRGIINETGIGSVNGAALGYQGVTEFETDVATANADAASMFYVTNPTVRGLLKNRPMFANSPLPTWGTDGMMNGYGTVVSNQIAAAHMFFGDFTWELLGYWGNLDLLVNPMSKDDEGIIRVLVYVDVDCRLRQAGAISASSTIS